MTALFAPRCKTHTVSGVEVVTRSLTAEQGVEFRETWKKNRQEAMFLMVFQTTFTPVGSRQFASVDEVRQIDQDAFDSLLQVAGELNGLVEKSDPIPPPAGN